MYIAHISADKRYESCEEHSRNTALLAQNELSAIGLGQAGYTAGLLHDCGKFTFEFNEYICKAAANEPVRKGSVIHTFAGVRYLLENFHHTDGVNIGWEDLTAEVLAAAVGGHHGLFDLYGEDRQGGFRHRLDKQPAYDARAIEGFVHDCADERELKRHFQSAQQEIKAFAENGICQYARGDDEGLFAWGLLVRLITSAVVSADRTGTAAFMAGKKAELSLPVSWAAAANNLNEYLAAFPMDKPIQKARKAFSDACGEAASGEEGLYRLDLPTGGGKTLAALRFAVRHAELYHKKRVYYISPLLSIIEQNAAVIREALGDAALVLEHHSNIVRDEQKGEELAQSELLQENWEAPVIITTLVQLLETMFSGKMSAVRRFHCLTNSVIIIDEVQSLPPRLLTLFNCAVNFLTVCCKTTVVLCSATQPTLEKMDHPMLPCRRIIEPRLLETFAPLFKRTRIIDGGAVAMQQLFLRAADLLNEVNSLLVICNTKKEAAELYERLESLEGVARFHLSAGMCMAHRKSTLSRLEKALYSRQKLVCVSTQLIEAGVDISFSAVIRLSAGLDNIVQAAGRCNRHGEMTRPGDVVICRMLGEKLGPLREITDAQHALNELLAEYKKRPESFRDDLSSDAAVEKYYHVLFQNRRQVCGSMDGPAGGQSLFKLLSVNAQFRDEQETAYYLAQAFYTAGKLFRVFEDDSESVLVPYGQGAELIEQLDAANAKYDIQHTQTLLRQAAPYAVSLPASAAERLRRKGMIYQICDGSVAVLNRDVYDLCTGVKEESDQCSILIL